MHEFSLMADLFAKMNSIAEQQQAQKIVKVEVKLGALSHISADHFREHFVHAAQGTCVEGAELQIETCNDIHSPDAQSILLKSVEIAQ